MSTEQRSSILLFIGGVSLGAAVVGAVCAYYWLPFDVSVKAEPQPKQKRGPPRKRCAARSRMRSIMLSAQLRPAFRPISIFCRSSSPRKVALPKNGDLNGNHTQHSAQNGSAEYAVGLQQQQVWPYCNLCPSSCRSARLSYGHDLPLQRSQRVPPSAFPDDEDSDDDTEREGARQRKATSSQGSVSCCSFQPNLE